MLINVEEVTSVNLFLINIAVVVVDRVVFLVSDVRLDYILVRLDDQRCPCQVCVNQCVVDWSLVHWSVCNPEEVVHEQDVEFHSAS